MASKTIDTKLQTAKERLIPKLKVVQAQLLNEDCDILALEVNARKLKVYHERVTSLRNDLEIAVTDAASPKSINEKFEKEIPEYEQLYCDVEEALAEITVKCEHREKKRNEEKTYKRTSGGGDGSFLNTSTIKLPKLPELTFDGDITMYHEFKQSFNATIDCTDLPDNKKLTYLKRMLIDDAENDLKGMPATDENYQVALKMLDEKYGNKNRVIRVLYNNLDQLPKTTSKSTKKLREKYDQIEVILRNLESFGESFSNNTILFNTVAAKFPKDIIFEVHKDKSGLTLLELRNNLQRLILQREELNFDPADDEENPTTTEALAVNNTTNTDKQFKPVKMQCIFCSSEAHWSDECDKYKTIETRKEKIKGRCFICLRKNHSFKECKSDRACVHCGKRQNHHRSLCSKLLNESTTKSGDGDVSKEPPSTTQQKPETTHSCLLSESENNWLLTAVTTISSTANNKTYKARLVLDAGSKRSYITSKLSHKLKLPVLNEEALSIGTFGDNKQETMSKVVNIRVHLVNGDPITIQANTISTIIDNIETFDPNQLEDKSVLQGKQLADTTTRTDVDILVGLDYLFDFLTSEIVQINKHQYLLNSKLGWLFAGKVNVQQKATKKQTKCLLLNAIRTDTTDDLKTLWELDTIGIKIPPDVKEEQVLQSFNENIKYEDNRYEVSWPWKEPEDDINLRPNYGLALGRLESLLKRSTPEYVNKYNQIIEEFIKTGIFEEVDESEPTENLIHYVPHHGVESASKTTPLRIVFDGSAKVNKSDKSLNDFIYKGGNLYANLSKVLINFCSFDDGIIGDISKAFLQIGLIKKDRDVVRFIWIKNASLQTTKNNIRILRSKRIPFGVNACSYILAATLRYHIQNYPNVPAKIILKLLKEFYADNLVSGEISLERLEVLLEWSIKILDAASMKLCQWQTNNKALITKYPKVEWNKEEIVSVLGLRWDTIKDTLTIKPACFDVKILTKRTILKVSSRIYDPLGYFSPITLRSKLILRQLWEENLDWDCPVSDVLQGLWYKLVADLQKLSSFEITRLYIPSLLKQKNVQLHVFTDASKIAYGSIVYIRVETDNSVDTRLVFAKSRVAPLRDNLTIPQLELIAAVIGTRAINFVKNSLIHCQFDKLFLWSDSKCVIEWIKSKKLLSTFVKNRVEEIRQSKDLHINYVQSGENPADVASRGATFEEITEGEFWWKGPKWLCEKESNWPCEVITEHESEEPQNEEQTSVLLSTETKNGMSENPFNVTSENFESLTKENLIQAIKHIQKAHFSDINSNRTKQLNLVEDKNGILKVKGRLSSTQHTDDDYPILLPSKGPFVESLILSTHRKLYHSGVSYTLAEVRKRFWLVRGRATVYHMLQKCKNCKFYSAPAYRYPPLPTLPDFRAKKAPAFAYTGVDTLGPLLVKVNRNNSTKKVWVCLFSCLITRAIRLELLEDMTAEETQLAFRRFFATRNPTQLLSDNAPQFHLLKNLFANEKLEWKMIPAFSPWSGGIYERMVSLVKNALRRTLFNVTLTLVQLRTAVVEVESIINSRPIAYVGADDQYILSPNDLINVQWKIPVDFDPTNTKTITGKKLIEGWRKIESQLNAFWDIWRYDYIESLRVPWVGKEKRQRSAEGPPKVGAIVLLQDKLLPRGRWKCGKIVELRSDREGTIRSAVVDVNGKHFERPINLLHPIEVN